MKLNIKWLVFCGLLILCFSLLSISAQLVETKEDRTLVGKTQFQLSQRLSGFATGLVIISAIEMVCLFVLLTQFKKTGESIQTDEVASALEGLDVSRILRKRDALSQSEMLGLMKNLAQELREANSIQQYLIERAAHVVCKIDQRGRFVFVSRASLSAWGYSAKELEGRLVGDIVQDGDRLVKSLLSATTNTQNRAVTETKLKVRDGEQLEVIWTAYWTADGCLFCVVQDVTERRRAESQLRMMLDSLPAGVLIAKSREGHGLVEFANGQACNLMRADRSLLVGRPLDDIWQYSFNLQGTEGGGEELYRTVAMRPDGTRFPVELSTRTIDFGDESKQLFVFLDITVQQETEHMKNEFLAMVTHDLRTPLASLQGMLVLLEKGILGELNDQGRRLAGKMTRDFDRLNRLISDMLDLEKVGSGKFQLELNDVSIDDAVEHAIDLMRLHAITKGITLSKIGDWSPRVYADRDQLVRVIVNLLSNALKYSPENSEIRVGCEDIGTHERVWIADKGRGIPPDKLNRIFEKFEQTEIADAKKSGGTGLGLAICRAIIREHGGQIGALNNRDGVGSTFWFTVPKALTEEQKAASIAETLREIPITKSDQAS